MVSGRRSAVILAAATLLLLTIVVPAARVGAVPLSQQKAAAQARVDKVRAQLDALNVQLERAGQEFDLATLKLAAVQQRLDKATKDLAVARYRLSVARVNLSNRAVAMYKQQPTDFLDVIFSSRSFSSLVDEVDTMQRLGANDSRIVNEVHTAADAVQKQRDLLVADRAQARQLLAQVKAKKDGIAATLAQRQQLLQSAQAEVKKIQHQEAVAAAQAAARSQAAARARAAVAAAAIARSSLPAGLVSPGANPGGGHPQVIAIAQRYLGGPYVYGAADPKIGFDCSGLVMYCYAQIGISLAHYSGYQQNEGVPVSMSALIPGDLVFMGYPVSYHVALYAGGGQVIEAPYTGAVVRYASVSSFQYAVRIP